MLGKHTFMFYESLLRASFENTSCLVFVQLHSFPLCKIARGSLHYIQSILHVILKGMSHQWLSEYSVVLGTQQSRVPTIPRHGKITKGTLHGQCLFFYTMIAHVFWRVESIFRSNYFWHVARKQKISRVDRVRTRDLTPFTDHRCHLCHRCLKHASSRKNCLCVNI